MYLPLTLGFFYSNNSVNFIFPVSPDVIPAEIQHEHITPTPSPDENISDDSQRTPIPGGSVHG